MKAAVYHGREDVRIEDVPAPTPGEGELLLRVAAAGICGTDAHEFSNGPHIYPITRAHPVSGHVGPMVPGHELAGVVVEVGPGVDQFAAGTLVVSGAGISCGECHWCRHGQTNLCANYETVGLHRHGALAEYVCVPANTCVDASAYGLAADWAALAQPMSIAVHAMRRGRLARGEVAVVLGVGGIGAFLTYAAVGQGATLVVSDLDEGRLAIASALGAEFVVRAEPGALSALLSREGLTPSVVYEVSGSAAGIREALAIAPRGARIVLVGLQAAPAEIDLRAAAMDEIELIGTNAHVLKSDLPEALRLLASREPGWGDIAPVALPLGRLVPDGLAPLARRESDRVKTLIDPWARETRRTHG